MLTNLFFPHVAGVRVERLWRDGATIHLEVVATRRWACCPLCQRRSWRQHSQRLAELDLEGLWAVVTHTAPDFAPPLRLNTAPPSSVPADPALVRDLRRERRAVSRLHALLRARRRPAYWFYGHFHESASEAIAGTRFVMVASMEMCVVWSSGD